MEQYTHLVPRLDNPKRLSDYLVGVFVALPSRKGVKKAIKRGLVTVDEHRGTTGLYISGNELIVYTPEPIVHQKLPNLDLKIHFEDDYIAIVEKPAGLLTSGNKWMTLANALPSSLQESTQSDALKYPQPAHRLDYPTSGLVLVGKTATSLAKLNKLFENQAVDKKYCAITIGDLATNGYVDIEVDKKTALSHYRRHQRLVSERFKYLNLVELNPKTGRRHQLRIHMAALSSPILGDRVYGTEGLILQGKGLYLHAHQITFNHPITNEEISVKAELPKKFKRIFSEIRI